MEFRLTQRHFMAANILLGAALFYVAWLCFLDIRNFTPTGEINPKHVSQRAGATEAGERTRATYDEIVKRDIFNLVPLAPAAAPPVVDEDLHLVLIGTSQLTASKPYAIIEAEGTNSQVLYRIGDQVESAGTLAAIEHSRVLIDHNGHRVALELPKEELSSTEPSGLSSGASEAPPRPAPHPLADKERLKRRLRSRHHHRGDDSGEPEGDAASPRERLGMIAPPSFGPATGGSGHSKFPASNLSPEKLSSQIHVDPHMVGGKVEGYSVSQVSADSVFDKLGLKVGDTITALDGQPVTNPAQGIIFLQSIPNRSAIDMTVTRNGFPIQLHLTLR
ncbi:MAG TPA: type II secretion system protein N [Candidatus Binataceae bacterium]|nr:type II secretion system protein N [Candidatus Binataceae bacterium]